MLKSPLPRQFANRCATCEKSQRANRHIWFLPTHKAKRKKPKEPIFLPRSKGLTMKRTKCILKNEIKEEFVVTLRLNFIRT